MMRSVANRKGNNSCQIHEFVRRVSIQFFFSSFLETPGFTVAITGGVIYLRHTEY